MIGKLSFHITHVKILGSLKFGKPTFDYYQDRNANSDTNLKKYYAGKFSETTGI